jgi:hypothetical protein
MISRFWRCFILGRQKMREGLEIKLIISLHNSSGLISPQRSVCGNGVFNSTDTVLPAYFPPQRKAILGSISEQFESGY